MVDVHCHILPGLDDGPRTLEAAVELARAAVAGGIDTVVATPHIRHDHPFAIQLMEERTTALRSALVDAGIALNVLSGGEIDLVKYTELSDEALASLCLGDGPYLLVESPYARATALLETALYDLKLRGFRPVLAHPERSATFLQDPARLERLVTSGVLCSVTALSAAGRFGEATRRFTVDLFSEGLVHNVASDAHDPVQRPPALAPAQAALENQFKCDSGAVTWFTEYSGRAMAEGRHLDGGPPVLERRSGWSRVKRRVRLAES